jgi:hypothetical protein
VAPIVFGGYDEDGSKETFFQADCGQIENNNY